MNDNATNIKKISSHFSKSDIFFIFLSFFILAISYISPTLPGISRNGQVMIGILLMAAILWITEPIPLPITGILLMITQSIIGIASPQEVFSAFGNQAVFFLLGAFIIAATIKHVGLHKRIAFTFLSFFKNNPKMFTFGIMSSCAFLSFIMPEHGVAALFLPIVTSILITMKLIPRKSNFGKVSMLCVAYGCSIGSLGTLVGGARNPLTIGILAEQGITVTFFDWMIYSMPIVFIALPVVWIILQIAFPIEITDTTVARKEIEKQLAIAGKISKKEINALIVLIFTILLWSVLSSHPQLGLASIAILGGILMVLTGSISWENIEKHVPWGIILLYGGAITLSHGMQTTGAGTWIAQQLLSFININPYVLILGIIIFTILLTNVISNVGAVAILLPIGLAISTEIVEISPVISSMLIALSGGLAFVLVIATPGNAITYSSGYFSTRDLSKAGIFANIICILIIFVVAVFYWKGFLGL
jgi:sodium-dependent dicarboxylate transporter 2/3/5